MGNFLDTPITDKVTEVDADPEKNMSYGCAAARQCHSPSRPPLARCIPAHTCPCPSRSLSAMQGWRSHMEDDHIQMLKLSEELQHLSLFGVFDGHGGEMARQRVAKGGLGPAADGVGAALKAIRRALLLAALACRRKLGCVESLLSLHASRRLHTTWRSTSRVTCLSRRY